MTLLRGRYSSSSSLPSLTGLLVRFGLRVLGPRLEPGPAIDCLRACRPGRPTTTGSSVSVANVMVEFVLDNGIGVEGRGVGGVSVDVVTSSFGCAED